MSPIVRLALVGVLGVPQAAMAAPFCLSVLGITPQCMYYDAALCQKDAGKQGGTCELNPAEAQTAATRGSGKYCVVMSGGAAICAYLDADSCAAAASRDHGACYFDSTGSFGTVNPYSVSNGSPQP